MIFKKCSARTYVLIMVYLLSALLVMSIISCRQAIPDKDMSYLSTLSGQVLSNCPNQSGKLCVINIGENQNIEIKRDIPENIMNIAPTQNKHLFAWSDINRSTVTSSIFIEDTGQTSEIRKIVQDGFVVSLSWSADDSYLAYTIFTPDPNDNSCNFSLFLQDISNPNHSLEPFAKCILDYAWSPFSNEIVYSLRIKEGKGTGLYKLNIETGETSILLEPTNELVHMSIQWSPDSQNISFVEGIGTMESTGYLVIIDAYSAKELHRVLPQECDWLSHNRLCYTWSPDSTKVAFIKSTSSASHFSLEDLYILNVTNGNVEQITRTEDYAIDDNFDRLGIRLNYPAWLTSSTIALFWTQDNQNYLVVTGLSKDTSLITKYENIPRFYRTFP